MKQKTVNHLFAQSPAHDELVRDSLESPRFFWQGGSRVLGPPICRDFNELPHHCSPQRCLSD